MKTLTYRQDINGSARVVSTDATFTSRFVTRNLRALGAALRAARASFRRDKNIPIRTHAEFRRTMATK